MRAPRSPKSLLLAGALLASVAPTAIAAGGCGRGEAVATVAAALAEDGGPDGGAVARRGDLVISQVYGGGGTTGASRRHDYVELFNRSGAAVVLTGLSLQVASATGAFGASPSAILALSGSIPAGGYFLVRLETSGATGESVGSPDQEGNLALDPGDGKVAIAAGTAPLACGTSNNRCAPTKVVDMVGFGSVSDYEGGQSLDPLDAKKAASRKAGGCTDTDENKKDFDVGAPSPRSGATPPAPCPVPDGGAPPPAVPDPPIEDEAPFDAGKEKETPEDAPVPDAEDPGCSVARAANGSAAPPLLLAALGLALASRRRRAAR